MVRIRLACRVLGRLLPLSLLVCSLVLVVGSCRADAEITAPVSCIGDCGSKGRVTVADLVIGVDIALARLPLSDCPEIANQTETVLVTNLVTAVNNSLNGCLATPTPIVETATPTLIESTATPTVLLPPTPTVTSGATVTPTSVATPTATIAASPTPTVEAATATATIAPTATLTSTPPATAMVTGTPTVTPTTAPTPDVNAVAGATVPLTNGLVVIPETVNAIVAGIVAANQPGGALVVQTDDIGTVAATKSCPVSGTVTQSGSLASTYTLELDQCEVNRPGGTVVFTTFDKMIMLSILGGTASVDVDGTIKNAQAATIATTTADFDATQLSVGFAVPVNPNDPCAVSIPILGKRLITGLTANITGDLVAATAGGSSVTLTFVGTNAKVENVTYAADCSVTSYKLTLNGNADIVQTGGTQASSFMVTFTNFVMSANVQDAFTEVSLGGPVSSLCFGGTASLATVQPLHIVTGDLCPNDGEIDVQNAGSILFNSDGSVTIDNMTFPSCQAVGACLG